MTFSFNQAVTTPLGDGYIVARSKDNPAYLLVSLSPDGRHRFILEALITARVEGKDVSKRKANKGKRDAAGAGML